MRISVINIPPMKIRAYPFEWEMGRGITLEDLFEHLDCLHNEELPFNNVVRMVTIHETGQPPDEIYAGLFLSVKDQKKFAALKREGSVYQLSVKELEENEGIIDFNFFGVRKDSGCGVYLEYHHSCSLNQFTLFCGSLYEEVRQQKVSEEKELIEERQGYALDDETIKGVEDAFRGQLKLRQIMRKETLDELIDELARIREFEFPFTVVEENTSVFSQFDQVAKTHHHRIKFKRDLFADIKLSILEAIRAGDLKEGTIKGVDKNNIEKNISILQNKEVLEEYEHDSIAETMDFDLEDISESWGVGEVERLCQAYRTILGAHDTPEGQQ